MRGAGQPPRTHPVIPVPILSFPHPILSFPYPILSFPRRRESSGLHPSDGGRP